MSLITELQEKASPSIPLDLKQLPFVPSANPVAAPSAPMPNSLPTPQLPRIESPPLPEVPLRAPIEPVQLYSDDTVDSISAGITNNFNNFNRKQEEGVKPPNVVEQSVTKPIAPLQINPNITSQKNHFNTSDLTADQKLSLDPEVANVIVSPLLILLLLTFLLLVVLKKNS